MGWSLQRCLSFLQCTAVEKMNLWSRFMPQYFYSRDWLNKILICDPFCFTLFLMFPCLFLMDYNSPKWQVYSCCSISLYLLLLIHVVCFYFHSSWMFSFVSFILGLLPWQFGILKIERGKWCVFSSHAFELFLFLPCFFDPVTSQFIKKLRLTLHPKFVFSRTLKWIYAK